MKHAVTLPEINLAPNRRPVMRINSNAQEVAPQWKEKVAQYATALIPQVNQRAIEIPYMLNSFYEMTGAIPKEVRDIEKQMEAGNTMRVFYEIDDLIVKLIDWRLKLSGKLTCDPI